MIGAEALTDRAAPGVCPYCGDPLAVRRPGQKFPRTCGDEVCLRARFRYYQRDHRARKRAFGVGKTADQGSTTPTVHISDRIKDS